MDLIVVVIAAIAVGVDSGNIAAGGIAGDGASAPGIIGVVGNGSAAGVGDANNIALQVLQEVEGRIIVNNAADIFLNIIQRNQNILAPDFLQDLRTVKGVGVLDIAYCFTGPDAVSVVCVTILTEGLQLPALLPGQVIAQIDGGISLICPVYPFFCTVSTNSAYHKSGRSFKRPLPLDDHETELGIRCDDAEPFRFYCSLEVYFCAFVMASILFCFYNFYFLRAIS